MSAVRLWRWVDSDGCVRADWALSPSTKQDIEGVWLPAAEHAALVALLGECLALIRDRDRVPVIFDDDLHLLTSRLDAALAGLEGRAK